MNPIWCCLENHEKFTVNINSIDLIANDLKTKFLNSTEPILNSQYQMYLGDRYIEPMTYISDLINNSSYEMPVIFKKIKPVQDEDSTEVRDASNIKSPKTSPTLPLPDDEVIQFFEILKNSTYDENNSKFLNFNQSITFRSLNLCNSNGIYVRDCYNPLYDSIISSNSWDLATPHCIG